MPTYDLKFTPEADSVLADLEQGKAKSDARKLKKVRRCLAHLERDPAHPGLHSHKYDLITGPNGEAAWECYVENHAPSAWRVWYCYGPEPGQITILTIGPHP